MMQEIYQVLENAVGEAEERIKREITSWEKSEGKDPDGIAQTQQWLINYGNEIETFYHLQDSKIIENFQECCELLFQYGIAEGNEKEYLDKLSEKIFEWKAALRQSVPITEYKLSVVAIVRNEGEYIREWLEYHLMLGVTHFYIYDNESTDDTKEKLQNYIERGEVTYVWWPGSVVQLSAYNHALEFFQYDTQYMAFIDADEFLVTVQDTPLCETVDQLFELGDRRIHHAVCGRCGGIGVNWRVYGTSFHKTKPEGLVIENYVYRAKDDCEENANIKTICNPRIAKEFRHNPHCVAYESRHYCVSENGSYIPNAFFYDGMCKKIRINHYYSKSEEELSQRLKKGKADQKKVFTEKEIQDRIQAVRDSYNEVYDPVMEPYIDKIKERLGKNRD